MFSCFGFINHDLNSQPWRLAQGISIDIFGHDYRQLCGADQIRYRPNNLWLLYQPEVDQVVSLIDRTNDGEYNLNPKNLTWDNTWRINYGDVPELKEITIQKANALWGPPISSNSEYSTYALATCPPIWYTYVKTVPKADFFVEAKFQNGYLKEYKLRHTYRFSIINTNWKKVDQKP